MKDSSEFLGLKGMTSNKIAPFNPDPDCRECGDKVHSKSNAGFYFDETLKLKECSCHKKWKKDVLIKTKAMSAGINCNSFSMKYDPDTSYVGEQSRMEVEKLKFVSSHFPMYAGSCLYAYGKNGTQKTTMSQWLGLALIRKGYTVQYLRMEKLIDLLQPNFETPEESRKKVQSLLNVDAIIIDEAFDPSKITLYKSGYQFGFLTDFLKGRIESNKFTMFVSNVYPSTIREKFTESLHDLIYRNTIQKGSLMEFKDVYGVVTNIFDVMNTFKDEK